MASSFPSFPGRGRGPSRVLGLLRRRPSNLSEGENGIIGRIRQAIGGVWLLIRLIVLIPLLLVVILGTVILILKIIYLFGVLL